MGGYLTPNNAFSAAKSETTYATDAFAGSDPTEYLAFNALNVNPVFEIVEYDLITPTPSGERHGIHNSHNEVQASIPLTGLGASSAAPLWDAMLRACNMKRSEPTSGEFHYVPVLQNSMTDTPSCTLAHYLRSIEDTTVKKWLTRGARGNYDLMLEQGKAALLNFTMQGMYAAEPTAFGAAPTLPTALTGDNKGMIVQTMVVTFGATTFKISKLNLASNWEILKAFGGDPGAGGGSVAWVGLQKAKSGSRFGGSFTLEGGAAEVAAMIAAANAGTVAELTITLADAITTATIVGYAQLGKYTQALPKFDVPYTFVRNPGDDGADGSFSIILQNT